MGIRLYCNYLNYTGIVVVFATLSNSNTLFRSFNYCLINIGIRDPRYWIKRPWMRTTNIYAPKVTSSAETNNNIYPTNRPWILTRIITQDIAQTIQPIGFLSLWSTHKQTINAGLHNNSKHEKTDQTHWEFSLWLTHIQTINDNSQINKQERQES